VSDKDQSSIVDLCSPIADEQNDEYDQPGVWSPSRRGAGYTGSKSATIACLVIRQEDEYGEFRGEKLCPLATKVQGDSRLRKSIRNVEFRATKRQGGEVGLLYRKVPYTNGQPNAWIISAENAVLSSVDQWGHFTIDRDAETYRFEPMPDPPGPPDDLPKVKKLLGPLLDEYVIKSMDHPVIQKLLQLDVRTATSPHDQEDDSSVY
jgi:hypothetical protein